MWNMQKIVIIGSYCFDPFDNITKSLTAHTYILHSTEQMLGGLLLLSIKPIKHVFHFLFERDWCMWFCVTKKMCACISANYYHSSWMDLECCSSIFFFLNNAHGYNVHKNNSCALMRTLTRPLHFSSVLESSVVLQQNKRMRGKGWRVVVLARVR